VTIVIAVTHLTSTLLHRLQLIVSTPLPLDYDLNATTSYNPLYPTSIGRRLPLITFQYLRRKREEDEERRVEDGPPSPPTLRSFFHVSFLLTTTTNHRRPHDAIRNVFCCISDEEGSTLLNLLLLLFCMTRRVLFLIVFYCISVGLRVPPRSKSAGAFLYNEEFIPPRLSSAAFLYTIGGRYPVQSCFSLFTTRGESSLGSLSLAAFWVFAIVFAIV